MSRRYSEGRRRAWLALGGLWTLVCILGTMSRLSGGDGWAGVWDCFLLWAGVSGTVLTIRAVWRWIREGFRLDKANAQP